MNTGANQPQTPREAIRAARILTIALMAGLAFFSILMAVVVLVNGPSLIMATDQNTKFIFGAVLIGLFLLAYFIGNANYNKSVKKLVNSPDTLMQRLNVYQSALIKYLALCEGPGIFAIILYFLTGNLLCYLVVAMALIAMYRKAPFGDRWATEIGAGSQDREEVLK